MICRQFCVLVLVVALVTLPGCSRVLRPFNPDRNCELVAGVDRPFNKVERWAEISDETGRWIAAVSARLGANILVESLFGWMREESESQKLLDQGYGYRLK